VGGRAKLKKKAATARDGGGRSKQTLFVREGKKPTKNSIQKSISEEGKNKGPNGEVCSCLNGECGKAGKGKSRSQRDEEKNSGITGSGGYTEKNKIFDYVKDN